MRVSLNHHTTYMKNYLLIVSILFSLNLAAQDEGKEEYFLIASDEWRKELIPFPLGFAPTLTYEGVEDIRFSKGWADNTSEEFWSYKFMWYLDKNPSLNEEKLQKDIGLYFDGIMAAVGKGKNIPSDSIVETNALFINSGEGLFRGKVRVFDSFFLRDQIVLNFQVKSFYCEERKKHIVYFNVSPQAMDHRIWNEMSEINVGGACE